jgi:TonB family protein
MIALTHKTFGIGFNVLIVVAMQCLVQRTAFGQTDGDTLSNSNPEIVQTRQQVPEFSGGEAGLFHYLVKHTKYPKAARRAGVQGVVYVICIIDAHGRVDQSSVRILEPVHPLLDAEAIRVVQSLPDWKPGVDVHGNAVPVYYKLPIRFVL